MAGGEGQSSLRLPHQTERGGANRLAENLLGLKAAGLPADTIVDSAIVDVAECQEPDGSWAAGEVQLRPPLSQSDFASTARPCGR